MAGINLPTIPRISDADLDDAKERRRIMNYLIKLDEQLRYMMTHLGTENLGTELVNVIDSKASAQQVSEVTGNIERLSTSITQTAEAITQKADKTEVDALGQTVASHSTQIQQTAEAITLKADQSDVDSLSGVVNQHTTQIQQNATAISAKASQSSVDALGNRVTSAETSLTLKADQATLTSTANNLQSQIDAVPGKITLAVNNVQVGGTNLLLKTATALSSTLSGGTNRIIGSYAFSNQYLSSTKAGKQVTCSFDWSTTATSGTFLLQLNASPWNRFSDELTISASNQSGHSVITLNLNAGFDTSTATGIMCRCDNLTGTITIKNLKLEWGNKATSWSPAPEDIDDAIAATNTELSLVPGKITAAVSNISIGGRNLLLGTATPETVTGLNGDTNQASQTHNCVPYWFETTKAGKQITLSFDWTTTASSGQVYVQTVGGPWGLGVPAFSITANSGHYEATVTATAALDVTTYPGIRLRFDNVGSSSNVATFTWSNVKLEFGNKATDWSPAAEELVNNSITIDTEGIKMSSSDVFQLVAANASKNSIIDIHGLFTADNTGGLTAARGSFADSLTVGGQRVLTLSDIGIPIKVATSQPSGHGFIWLQPSSVTSVRYTGYTADSRNSTVMFSTSQRTITRSFAAEASNTLANGTFTYTLTFEVMSLSDAQLTGVTFSASATKGSTVSFGASSAISLSKYQTATITLTATSSTNLASNANAISVAITATASSYGGLYLNSKQWMTLTIAKSGGSGTQACNVYYIP